MSSDFAQKIERTKMPQRSQISLCKLLLGYRFQRCLIPKSPIPLNSLTQFPIQRSSNSVPPSKPQIPIPPSSKSQSFPHPNRLNSQSGYTTHQSFVKLFSTESGESVSELDKNKEVNMINLKFAEAREEIDMALESKETVYFNEEAECARDAVKEVLDMFEGLLAKLPDSEKAALQRSMGLKMEQLKAELEQLND